MSVLRQAGVYVREQFAGLVQETDAGYCFTYDPGYLRGEHPCAVSLTLPLRKESYISNTLLIALMQEGEERLQPAATSHP